MPELYTTTLTSKGQFTVPKAIRNKLAVGPGTKFEVAPHEAGFLAKPKRQSKILDLAGIFENADDGRPWDEVIEEVKSQVAIEIINKVNRKRS